jgi:hypothetical protein
MRGMYIKKKNDKSFFHVLASSRYACGNVCICSLCLLKRGQRTLPLPLSSITRNYLITGADQTYENIWNIWHLTAVFPVNVINKELCCQELCHTGRMYVSEVVEEAVRQRCVATCNSASIDGFLSGSWCAYRFMWACDLDIGQFLLCISCLSVCVWNQF